MQLYIFWWCVVLMWDRYRRWSRCCGCFQKTEYQYFWEKLSVGAGTGCQTHSQMQKTLRLFGGSWNVICNYLVTHRPPHPRHRISFFLSPSCVYLLTVPSLSIPSSPNGKSKWLCTWSETALFQWALALQGGVDRRMRWETNNLSFWMTSISLVLT